MKSSVQKLILGCIAVVGFAGCATTQMPPTDPYAANHTEPQHVRKPSSEESCEALRGYAPDCQIGDSYVTACGPSGAHEGALRQTKYECQKTSEPCRENDGTPSSVESFGYAAVTSVECKIGQ